MSWRTEPGVRELWSCLKSIELARACMSVGENEGGTMYTCDVQLSTHLEQPRTQSANGAQGCAASGWHHDCCDVLYHCPALAL